MHRPNLLPALFFTITMIAMMIIAVQSKQQGCHCCVTWGLRGAVFTLNAITLAPTAYNSGGNAAYHHQQHRRVCKQEWVEKRWHLPDSKHQGTARVCFFYRQITAWSHHAPGLSCWQGHNRINQLFSIISVQKYLNKCIMLPFYTRKSCFYICLLQLYHCSDNSPQSYSRLQ